MATEQWTQEFYQDILREQTCYGKRTNIWQPPLELSHPATNQFALTDFKTSEARTRWMGPYAQAKNRINKSGNPWVSETQDNFRRAGAPPSVRQVRPAAAEAMINAFADAAIVWDEGLKRQLLQGEGYNVQRYLPGEERVRCARCGGEMRCAKCDEKVRCVKCGEEMHCANCGCEGGIRIQSAVAASQRAKALLDNAHRAPQIESRTEKLLAGRDVPDRPPSKTAKQPSTIPVTPLPEQSLISPPTPSLKSTPSPLASATRTTKTIRSQRVSARPRSSALSRPSRLSKFTGTRPAFCNYGQGNISPTSGGVVYGDYLRSFNVNPQAGQNRPPRSQVFKSTQIAALSRGKTAPGGGGKAFYDPVQKRVVALPGKENAP